MSQIPLADFQRWMQQMLLDPYQRTEVDAYAFLPETLTGRSPEAVVNGSERLDARGHLAIYQRSYIARLRNCMAQHFSALAFALGEDLFRAFADLYLAENPSTHYKLGRLGDGFVRFLQNSRPDADAPEREDWIDFMIELAGFEHELGIAFEESIAEPYELAEAGTPDDRLRFLPHGRLFSHEFPIPQFYASFKGGNSPDLPFAARTYCLVIRQNYRMAIYDLQVLAYEFLLQIKSGRSVSAVFEELAKTQPSATDQLRALWPVWRKNWVAAGVLGQEGVE